MVLPGGWPLPGRAILFEAVHDFAIDVDGGSQLLDFFQKRKIVPIELLDDPQHERLGRSLRRNLFIYR